MKEFLNIPYSQNHKDRRLMDVFLPAGYGNGAGILFIHGGGWKGGDKAQWRDVARHFCGLGYVCASATYRFAPEWKFPAQVEDVRLAMQFFRQHAGEYGFSTERAAAVGSSSGAHLVLMLATIGQEDELGLTDELTLTDTRPNVVAAYCPVVTVHKSKLTNPELASLIHPCFMPQPESAAPDLYRQASIEDRITGAEPPILIIHGEADELIPASVSEELCEKVNRMGGLAEAQVLPGVGHGFGYGTETDAQKTAIRHIEQFLPRNL